MSLAERLFEPVHIGPYTLPNRIVMGPMTRNRAADDGSPTGMMTTYYAQRAGAGLIVSEGAQVSSQGRGYPATPGLHEPSHEAGWRAVTEAVHAAGGRIFAQLWHVGRVSHSGLQPDGGPPVAPSAIPAEGMLYTPAGMIPYETPRALERQDIADVVEQFRAGAALALEAGFDGVEVQAANGYLIDQFLRDGSNHRTDDYGGSIANRARLLVDVLDAVVGVAGAARTGVRLSPLHPWNGMSDTEPQALFDHVTERLAPYGLAYLHLVRSPGEFDWAALKTRFQGPVIAAGGYDAAAAAAVIEAGEADMVAFSTAFIANPDLVERLRCGAPLATPDRKTFYGGGEKGYIDYPRYE